MERIEALIPEDKKHILASIQQYFTEMLAGQKKSSSWKGHRFLPGYEPETIEYAYESYEVQPDTVFLITFPKTGTNWAIEIVSQIMYGHDEELNTLVNSIPPLLRGMATGPAEKFQLLDYIPVPRRMTGGHLPQELVNLEKIKKKNGKVIVVLRNPKDQAVSWFHFTKENTMFDSERDKFSRDWPQFLEDYMQGKQPILGKEGECYLDFILGWHKHKDNPNVLLLYYEDMKKDIEKEIRRIARFIDVDLTDERVGAIAECTTFSKMKTNDASKDTGFASMRSKMNVMRKGEVGGWKEVFTVAHSETMDKLVEEKLGKTDIKFTYEL